MGYAMLCTIIVGLLLFPLCTDAAIFYLDSYEDLPDTNPGDGVAVAANGKTTLRAAIEEANALPGKHEIVFSYGASSKAAHEKDAFIAGYARVRAPLVISGDLVINKGNFPYATFDPIGSEQFRVLEVLPGVRLEMGGIHIEERPLGVQHILTDYGASLYIHPGAYVVLNGCTVRHGIATVAGGGIYIDRGTVEVRGGYVLGHSEGDGGGIFNDRGSLYLRAAGLQGTAGGRGGAIFNNYGEIHFAKSSRPSSLSNSTAVFSGGALYNCGGIVAMESVSVNNNAAAVGGAIYHESGAWLDMFGSSFFENTADYNGGSVYMSTGTLRAAMSTFSRGSAGLYGAGIYLEGGTASFLNCTIVENKAATTRRGAGGGIFITAGAGAICSMGNTIIAHNEGHTERLGMDIAGEIISLGHNLIRVSEGGTGFADTDHLGSAITPLSPMLQYALSHEGSLRSPKNIFIPQPGSPVIDAGDTALLFHPDFVGGLCFDARLSCCPRVRGAAVDIGAIEVQEGEIGLECSGSHSADYDRDNRLSLSELLRVFQFYNSGEYHCESWTEDGFDIGPGDQDCAPHSADYAPQDWRISLRELLRLIQFYNSGGYYPCPGSEDGFCPGSAA